MAHARLTGIVLLFFTLTGCSLSGVPPVQDRYLQVENRRITSALEDEIARLHKRMPTEMVIQQKHGGTVNDMEFSPDGTLLVTSSDDGLIKIWDAKNGKLLHNLKDKNQKGSAKKEINAVAFSPDGKYIVSGGKDASVKIWDVKTGTILKSFFLTSTKYGKVYSIDEVYSVDYSPDGKRIIAGGSKNREARAKIWDISSGKMVLALQGHSGRIRSIQYSPNGKLLLSGSKDKTLKLWDARTGHCLSTMRGAYEVECSAFSPDGQFVAGGFKKGLVKVWKLKSGKRILTKKTHSPIYKDIKNIKFSPDGRYLYFSTHTHMSKLNLTNGQVENFEKEYCDTFDISPDGKQIANADMHRGIDIWDNHKKKILLAFNHSSRSIRSIAVSPDEQSLLSGGYEGTLNLWDMKNGKLTRSIPKSGRDNIYSVAFSPDSKRMIGAGYDFDKKTNIRDVSTGETVLTLVNKKSSSNNFYNAIQFSPDGKSIWSGSDEMGLQRWNAATGTLERSYKWSKKVNSIALSPDGSLVAAGLDPFGIKVLNVRNGKEILFKQALSRNSGDAEPKFLNNRVLLIGGAFRLKRMNLKTGQISTYKNCGVNVFDLSPANKFIIGNDYNGDIQLWDLSKDKLIRTFKGHSGWVTNVKFAQNGKLAISSGNDGTIRYWNVETGEQICLSVIDKSGEWVVITPSGEFDKSQGFEGLHWVRGLEVLELDQFFDHFYKPGLMARVIKMDGDTEIADGKTMDAIMASPPPTVKIISPKALGADHKEDAKVAISPKGTMEVVLEVKDNGGGIKNITLFHNGKPVNRKQRGIKKIKKSANNSQVVSFIITLLDGKNTFTAVAKSRTGIESRPFTAAILYKDKDLEKPDAYFVVVGINKYKNTRYNLNYGRADAEAISALFKKRSKKLFKTMHVTELFDAKATKRNINRALKKVVQSARPKDVFMLYYAGHGVMLENKKGKPHFYIAPHEVTSLYREKNVWANGISAEQLTGYSKKIKAKKQMLIMDACQAGGFEQTFAMRGAVEEKALKQLSRSSGLYLLAATQSEQFATEFASLKHGVFTYALLQGLKGEADGSPKDGKMTVRELSAFIEDKVPGLTEKHRGNAQYPSIYGRGQDFPILLSQ